MGSTTTAKSQVMAVCCAALVGHRHPPTTTQATAGPCPTMTEWARSPALVRQWADDWVLSPLWDAVFHLPIDGTTWDTTGQQHFLFVSVSLTLGVLSHSWFTCGGITCDVCGCIGDNKVLMYVPKRGSCGDEQAAAEHIIRDTAAGGEARNPECRCLPETEASLAQWEQVRFTTCNRKWIVGCHVKGSALFIRRVVSGSPFGDDVILKASEFSRGFVPQFTPLGNDVVMLRELGEHSSAALVFVDLWESFNKKDLVVTSKIVCRTNWPMVDTGITWLPDGSLCILKTDMLGDLSEKKNTDFCLVEEKSNATVWDFPEKQVTILGKNHLLAAPSIWWSGENSHFKVFHTGDLAHPSLHVPSTWATGEWQSSLILSTSYHNPEHTTPSAQEIEFSLYDGLTGCHIEGEDEDVAEGDTQEEATAAAPTTTTTAPPTTHSNLGAHFSYYFVATPDMHNWDPKRLPSGWCAYCKQNTWTKTPMLQCRRCAVQCHEKCTATVDTLKIPCTPEELVESTPISSPSTLIGGARAKLLAFPASPTTPPPIPKSVNPNSISMPLLPTPEQAAQLLSMHGTPISRHTSVCISSHLQETSTISSLSLASASHLAISSPQLTAPPPLPAPVAESIFASLPVRSSTFQSGRFRIETLPHSIEFTHPFTQAPRVCAWVMGGTGLSRIPSEQLTISLSGFRVDFCHFLNVAVNWVAYIFLTTNPLLSDTIKLILASPPQMTPPLMQKVEKCVEANSVNGASSDGQTLLHAAAYAGNLDVLNWALKRSGVNIDAQDERGWTPLMCAINPSHWAAALRLLAVGAKISIANYRQHTALHLFAKSLTQEKSCEDVMKLLLAPPADPNLRSETGETALLFACSGPFFPNIVTAILEAHADPNIADNSGVTPLCKATMANNIPLIELLLRHGADPSKGPQGETPKDRAQASNNTYLIELFSKAASLSKEGLNPHTVRSLPGWNSPTADLGAAIAASMKGSNSLAFAAAAATPGSDKFFATLEKPECKELRVMVDSFIKNFSKNKYTLEQEGDALAQFFSDLLEAMKQHTLWSSLQEQQMDIVFEGTKKAIFLRMYNQLFTKKELQIKDTQLSKHIARISPLVRPQNMHLREDLDYDLISAAEAELQEMDNVVTPDEKLLCILNCCKVLVNVLQSFGSTAGADDFLPLFIFTVLRANVPRLHSNLSFIDRFSNDRGRSSEAYCFYTHLMCAATYIETDITVESLKAASSTDVS
ncbi:Vacuolar protein sorting-associated protein 9A [Pelomyxa schiedti]|nr:Vacuolar protein sorting-associated protein 9A [Pelomyxa schiedti]